MARTTDTLEIRSALTEIEDARSWLAGHARASGLDDDSIWAVELAATEALSNVVRHAYRGDPNRVIRLELGIDDERLELAIEDDGQGFDPGRFAPAGLEAPGAGGYGLFLMNEVMDEVVYDRLAHGTRLRLVKYRPEVAND